MFLGLFLCLRKRFLYWIADIVICEKFMVMISKAIAVCVFFFVYLIVAFYLLVYVFDIPYAIIWGWFNC